MRISKKEEEEVKGHECIGLCCDDLVDINERDDL
ncbi:hypothetical protein SJAV_06720 [Sulfurisphaera javensis]|uniref:Uncharacterized protein n=1 Tax=Sulfurisphaera javensis TaxID=2049879 RepID=A0AAT9GPG4_9CREN